MNRKLLEQPFAPGLIKTRRGHSGKTLSYTEGVEYIRRLNQAFNGEWSFEIDDHHILTDSVVVIGKLIAEGITKTAFGGSAITRDERGAPSSLADDLKAASTDALKKASSLFGLGLHLYGLAPAPPRPLRPLVGEPRPIAPNLPLLTERQLHAIEAIARALGWSSKRLREHTMKAFGTSAEHLLESDASKLIGELQELTLDHAAHASPDLAA